MPHARSVRSGTVVPGRGPAFLPATRRRKVATRVSRDGLSKSANPSAAATLALPNSSSPRCPPVRAPDAQGRWTASVLRAESPPGVRRRWPDDETFAVRRPRGPCEGRTAQIRVDEPRPQRCLTRRYGERKNQLPLPEAMRPQPSIALRAGAGAGMDAVIYRASDCATSRNALASMPCWRRAARRRMPLRTANANHYRAVAESNGSRKPVFACAMRCEKKHAASTIRSRRSVVERRCVDRCDAARTDSGPAPVRADVDVPISSGVRCAGRWRRRRRCCLRSRVSSPKKTARFASMPKGPSAITQPKNQECDIRPYPNVKTPYANY